MVDALVEGNPAVDNIKDVNTPSSPDITAFKLPFPDFVSTDVSDRRTLAIQNRKAREGEIREIEGAAADLTQDGALGFIKAVEEVDATHSAIADIYAQSGFKYDPQWRLPDEDSPEGKRLFEGIPTDFIGEIALANSPEQAIFISDLIRAELKQEQRIAAAGGVGIAARIGLNFLDPIALGIGYLSGGASYLTKTSRLKRFVQAGFGSAALNAGIEAIIVEGSPTRDTHDIFYAALLGFGLGGAFSLIRRSGKADQIDIETARIQERASFEEADMATRNTPPDTIEELMQIDSTVAQARGEPELDPLGRGSVGAAAVAPEAKARPLVNESDFIPDGELDALNPKSLFNSARLFDTAKILNSADDPTVREFGKLVREPVGFEGTEVRRIGASETAKQISDVKLASFYRSRINLYAGWLKENGHSKTRGFTNNAIRADFNAKVGKTIRGEKFEGPGAEQVNEFADINRVLYRDFLADLKNEQIAGADEIPFNANFLPRQWDKGKVQIMNERFGTGRLEKFIGRSIKRKFEGLDDSDYNALGRAFLTRIRKRHAGIDDEFVHGMNLLDEDFVRTILQDGGVANKQIDGLLKRLDLALKKTAEKKGRPTALKNRLDLDELHQETLLRQDGTEESIKISDLLFNDAETLFNNYTRVMSGHLAIARTMGVKSRAEFNARVNRLKSRQDAGKPVTDKQIETIEAVYAHVTGQSLEAKPGSRSANLARVLRDYQFARVMQQVGWAQLGDLGNLIGPQYLRVFLQHIPELRSTIRRARTGRLQNDLAAELEEWVGFGTDFLRDHSYSRFDEDGFGTGFGPPSDRIFHDAVKKTQPILAKTSRVTQLTSGMAMINNTLQRITMKAVAQKMTNLGTGVIKPGSRLAKRQIRRMNDMGLDDAMIKRVLSQLKKHADISDSIADPRRKISRINFEKFDDIEARDSFIAAIARESKRVIQEGDIGSENPWMHSTLGKIIFQFRRFIINSYTMQTLHAIRFRDIDALGGVLGTMLTATLAYTAQNYLLTIGNKKEREKRLALDRIAAASFARSMYASILPGLYDTTVGAIYEPVFSYSRASGQLQNYLTGNPTVSFVLGAKDGVDGILKALLRDDYQFSQKDARNLRRMLMFQNLTGLSQIFDLLERQLPKSSKEGEGENIIN